MSCVAIDAMGNAAGGGREVLNRCLQVLLERPNVHAHIWCVRASDLGDAWRTHPRVTVRPEPRAGSAMGRVWWYTNGFSQAITSKFDAVLSLNAMGIAQVPQINLIQQPMLQASDGLACQPWRFVSRMMMIRALATASCQRAQGVAVQTPSMKTFARRGLGVGEETLHVFTPDAPVPLKKHSICERKHDQVLYIGHDEPYKNVDALIKAVSIARKTHPTLTLTTTTHRRRIDGVEDAHSRIWWRAIGPQSSQRVSELYATSTLLAMPSLTETVGLPMLEAMTYGLPVLASDRAFAHDICGAGNAHFVDTRSPDALADALIKLIQDDAAQARLSERGRARAASLRQTRPYHQLVDLLLQHT